MSHELVGRGPAVERRPAGEQEVEGAPEAVDVGPHVHVGTVHRLLRGDIVGGAQDNMAFVLLRHRVPFAVREEPGQPQVENLDRTGAVEEQVAGLDVAVDPAGLMGVLQPLGRLPDVVAGAGHVHRAVALDDLVE